MCLLRHSNCFNQNQANDARGGKKSKITRDRDRDVSEQIALGQSNLASTGGGDHAYDQRLFDQVTSKLPRRHFQTIFSHIF